MFYFPFFPFWLTDVLEGPFFYGVFYYALLFICLFTTFVDFDGLPIYLFPLFTFYFFSVLAAELVLVLVLFTFCEFYRYLTLDYFLVVLRSSVSYEASNFTGLPRPRFTCGGISANLYYFDVFFDGVEALPLASLAGVSLGMLLLLLLLLRDVDASPLVALTLLELFDIYELLDDELVEDALPLFFDFE